MKLEKCSSTIYSSDKRFRLVFISFSLPKMKRGIYLYDIQKDWSYILFVPLKKYEWNVSEYWMAERIKQLSQYSDMEKSIMLDLVNKALMFEIREKFEKGIKN